MYDETHRNRQPIKPKYSAAFPPVTRPARCMLRPYNLPAEPPAADRCGNTTFPRELRLASLAVRHLYLIHIMERAVEDVKGSRLLYDETEIRLAVESVSHLSTTAGTNWWSRHADQEGCEEAQKGIGKIRVPVSILATVSHEIKRGQKQISKQ